MHLDAISFNNEHNQEYPLWDPRGDTDIFDTITVVRAVPMVTLMESTQYILYHRAMLSVLISFCKYHNTHFDLQITTSMC